MYDEMGSESDVRGKLFSPKNEEQRESLTVTVKLLSFETKDKTCIYSKNSVTGKHISS